MSTVAATFQGNNEPETLSWLNRLALLTPLSLVLFIIRTDVAWQFFKSGLTKISEVHWWFIFPTFDIGSGALFMFEENYHVPFFEAETAAQIASHVELVIPVFLFIGLGTRIAAFIMFGFNLVAVISYFHGLWPTGLIDHFIWAVFFLILLASGPGTWSLDKWVVSMFSKR